MTAGTLCHLLPACVIARLLSLLQSSAVRLPLVRFVHNPLRYLPNILSCLGAHNSPTQPRITPRSSRPSSRRSRTPRCPRTPGTRRSPPKQLAEFRHTRVVIVRGRIDAALPAACLLTGLLSDGRVHERQHDGSLGTLKGGEETRLVSRGIGRPRRDRGWSQWRIDPSGHSRPAR